ncbi:hypothetical protein [Burkholderia ubonensis]|uniref:hypothetical protein n=1 Tax=Burkholderia ubonensis TaxID=101571 RepID=UPI0012FA793F|nr:hypothetical protein [Burkholderia ubonensis]
MHHRIVPTVALVLAEVCFSSNGIAGEPLVGQITEVSGQCFFGYRNDVEGGRRLHPGTRVQLKWGVLSSNWIYCDNGAHATVTYNNRTKHVFSGGWQMVGHPIDRQHPQPASTSAAAGKADSNAPKN